MSRKSELAMIREQQLASLREMTGTPERFVVDFACAMHDRAFRVTFARFSSAQRFRCESVDKAEPHQATTTERLQGLLRPAGALRVRSEEMDFSSVSCVWCAEDSGWTLCSKCKAMVCGARSFTRSFTCRDSCGAQFQTEPLDVLDAAAGRARQPARDRARPEAAAGERPAKMTGGIFKEDESALRQAEQKPRLKMPRLKWPSYLWPVFVGLSYLNGVLSDPRRDDGEIIGAYIRLALIAAILIFRMQRRIPPPDGRRGPNKDREQP